MRTFNISKEIHPYVKKILDRRKINYIDNKSTLTVDLSGNQFHKVVTRARCEKLNENNRLNERYTYYVSKIENPFDLRLENPKWEFFIEFPHEKHI